MIQIHAKQEPVQSGFVGDIVGVGTWTALSMHENQVSMIGNKLIFFDLMHNLHYS